MIHRAIARIIKEYYSQYKQRYPKRIPIMIRSKLNKDTNVWEICIYTRRPGILIGYHGKHIEELSKLLKEELDKHNSDQTAQILIKFEEMDDVIYV